MTTLLAKVDQDGLARKTFEAVLNHLGRNLTSCVASTPVWDFFESGLKSRSLTMIQHNGVDKSVAVAVIDTMIDAFKSQEIQCDAPALGYALIELSRDDQTSTSEHLASARILLQMLLTKASMDADLLTQIWGQAFFPKSQKQPSKVLPISDEASKWRMTHFYLETIFGLGGDKGCHHRDLIQPLSHLLKRALQQQHQTDHSYSLDLLISSLLEISNGLEAEIKEKYPMDTELVVQCIRGCVDPNTKALALMLLAKSTVSSNVAYILHNR